MENNIENKNADKELIPFLRNLANSIEENKLSPEQLQSVGEFFVSYNDTEVTDDDFDVIKFIVLGWYIYQMLSRGNENKDSPTGPTEEEETLL